MSLNWAP